ncbi:beta-galactosidase [Demequina sp. SYSU T00192]|uniref:Beta-galactosidase n=1 Tax=Demequina litoralis TaxID=3051660 RepID=A0ABT8GBI3_9MICO|nr:beta-galactosidase [Demequina sp. SYSU T00192]MDN4476334.1 beta-galactosidase [Demequina sp. SYSU T00192]
MFDSLWYGGDYNPEQWTPDVWDEDVRLMQRAGVTVATVAVFSWARLEPADGEFDFAWLDDVLDRLHAGGIGVDLATATAAPPPWLVREHPDVLPVMADGTVLGVGSRQHYSPSSATYRTYAARLATRIVDRYADHPAVIAWHVNNEYGCHVPRCWSDESAGAFRVWLAERYGDIETLNDAWGTAFWSQHYASFDEVMPPRAAPASINPTEQLDFDRFSSDALLALHRMECDIIRARSDKPITTNFMGFFKPVDYWRWAQHVDFVTDDAYPDPADPRAIPFAAAVRDLMRSLAGDKPWLLMEQATSAVNWRPRNAPKPAGMFRRLSLQSIARGADGIMQFQWRQSVRGSEKFHSAMVPHAGEDTRIYREVCALGEELAGLTSVIGSRVPASTAILFDWDSWWAVEQTDTPARVSYLQSVLAWHGALYRAGVTVDFASKDSSLDGYDLVIVPTMQVVTPEVQQRVAAARERGATVLVTYQSAILDEGLGVLPGGYLGSWQELLGVRVEEFAPYAQPDQFFDAPAGAPSSTLAGELAGEIEGWSEVVHADAAEVLATFTEGLAADGPAITRRAGSEGAGAAWYVATQPSEALADAVVARLLADSGVAPVARSASADVETVRRGDRLFLINHGATAAEVEWDGGSATVEAGDVTII